MRWWVSIAAIVSMLGCDSNPTPHPSRSDDVRGGELGGQNEADPDDLADTSSPAAEPDGAFNPDNNLAGDTGDVGADDGNETSEVSDASPIDASPVDAAPIDAD